MRFAVLAVSIVAILAFAALTAVEFSNNGVTFAGVVSVGVLIVVGVGVIGAALHPPRK